MTSSSSDGPPNASPVQGHSMLVAPHATSPRAPNPVRFPGGAEEELRRRLAEHERGLRDSAERERSRERREPVPRHSIAYPGKLTTNNAASELPENCPCYAPESRRSSIRPPGGGIRTTEASKADRSTCAPAWAIGRAAGLGEHGRYLPPRGGNEAAV